MKQYLTLVTLGVDDIDTMRRFYSETLGWQAIPYESENIVFYNLNGIQLALFSKGMLADETGVTFGDDAHRPFTLAHNLPSREEVDALFAELEERGATILKGPREVFWGGYSGYVSDPEGNLWEIAHNPFMTLDDEGNVVTEQVEG